MQFDSWGAFLAMGGHGLYVWLAYGGFVAALLWNLGWLWCARRRILMRLRRERGRRAAAGGAGESP
ncbi:MAG: heme exporter protein CcmD [Cellvibrionales bacterium]|nr:heme exporter protein CcmD [Cellvibrionales bacterium]